MFKTITQGGQVHIHQLLMLKQVLVVGGVVACMVAGGYFAWESRSLPTHTWRMAYETYWAKFMLSTVPEEKHKTLMQLYRPLQGPAYRRGCLSILKDPLIQQKTKEAERFIEDRGYKSLIFAGCTFLAIMVFWFGFGLAQKRTQHQRGNTFVPWRRLASLLKRKREASDLTLGKLPLIKHKETSHILITGTTGSGKTNAFHILLPQIRRRQNRAVVLDITGDYVSRYYDPRTDIILNPLDTRSKSWHPWIDCHLDSHYDVLAESFIQTKAGVRDPFWDNASRAVLKTALRKYASQGNTDVQKMITFLMSASDKDFEDFFKDTEAATFTFKNNEKTTNSIRSVLSSQIEGLRQLETTSQPFSLRNWVQNEKKNGWLFITARADQRQTLTPLISAWMDITINALMILSENQQRRVWFVIDELAALQKLPRLQAGLAEGRKYGGCLLVGFQSKPQLEEIYGRHGTEAMLDLFNTKVFFRCTEPSTQAWISKVLGDKEEAEPQENISYGAHSMRDGVSLSRHTRQKPLVMPGEFSQLKDLECYVKLPGDYPCTKLQTKYQKPSVLRQEPFLLKPEKVRIYGTLPSTTSNVTSVSTSTSAAISQSGEIPCM
jgi:type IV conjugative transfer system coupling protein TraD